MYVCEFYLISHSKLLILFCRSINIGSNIEKYDENISVVLLIVNNKSFVSLPTTSFIAPYDKILESLISFFNEASYEILILYSREPPRTIFTTRLVIADVIEKPKQPTLIIFNQSYLPLPVAL